MKGIDLPNMRRELTQHMRALSDVEYQRHCWVKGDCPAGVEYDSLDYAINFLFDDTSLAENPHSAVGHFLYDEKEALAILAVCRQLEVLLDNYGSFLSDAEYISKPCWSDVVSTAGYAWTLMSLNDPD